MWALMFTGNWRDQMAKVAAAQQQPSSFFGFLQMLLMIWYPNCDGRPVIVLVNALAYES